MNDYEYCVQWYHPHGVDSWIRTGWHDGHWCTLEDAQVELDNMASGIWARNDLRIVCRAKAGPIKVVE